MTTQLIGQTSNAAPWQSRAAAARSPIEPSAPPTADRYRPTASADADHAGQCDHAVHSPSVGSETQPGAPTGSRPAPPKPASFTTPALGPTLFQDSPAPPTYGPGLRYLDLPSADPLQQARFDNPAGWTAYHQDERFAQRYQIDRTGPKPEIYCETKARLKASPDRVLAALQGPWDWYGGRYAQRETLPDGKVRYQLWPAGIGIHVQETMSPAEPLTDGGWRLRINLEKDATGLAYLEVHPGANGTSELVGRFAGVEQHTLFTTERFTKNHLLAERGALIPFHRGGFEGLAARVEV